MAASPILSTRCTLPEFSLWFGRAQLFAECVRLSGWTWSGRFERDIQLGDIERVKWWAAEDVNFLLHLDDGTVVPMRLHQNAGIWNYQLRDLLGMSGLAQSRDLRVRPRRKKAA
jgi:hypothetical protein